MASASATFCEHCGGIVPSGAESARFCCNGCAAVNALLVEQGLSTYYELAGGEVTAVDEPASTRSHVWLEALLTKEPNQGLRQLLLDVQGVHCTACVWLMNETFRRRAGAREIVVNPALGTVRLVTEPSFDVLRWVRDVEAFGYQFGPPKKLVRKASTDLPMRLGVTAAITVNVMLFSVAFYFGLNRDDSLFTIFTWLSAALSTASVIVGGGPFLTSAWRGARHGVMHLDLPIAVGIVLVYVTSLTQVVRGRGELAYFDTLNTFITLMLVGRWLQERVVERNRRYLLDDDGAEGLWVRKIANGHLSIEPAPRIVIGDTLLIAPGELVPLEARLLDGPAQLSSEWMTGESRGRTLERGALIDAGSFNAGRSAFQVIATQHFADSSLVELLRRTSARGGARQHEAWWRRFSRRWVLKVLVLAGVGFAAWLPFGLERATSVAAAVLVVTCPCAIGLAIPLAYELAQTRLRRRGFFIRSDDLLERLLEVRKVVFDKTGTLTLGRLELTEPEVLGQCSPLERDVAFNLAVRSAHPVSAAIASSLERWSPRYEQNTGDLHEVPGSGLEWHRADGRWRLGKAAWASPATTGAATVLSHNGRVVVSLEVREVLRHDAASEVARLGQRGLEVWLLSGDEEGRTQALARSLGITETHVHGGLSPHAKVEWLEKIGASDALYLGDGVNDALAFECALAAGTPAIDRPVIPSQSDFFMVGGGLFGLHEALDSARHLRGVVRRLMAISLFYNFFAVLAALAGAVSPLVAAVVMPTSTLSLLALTVWAFAERDARPVARGLQGVEAT